MDAPILTAIISAFTAAIMTGIIKLVEWYGGRKALIKTIKVGLFQEIFYHHIIELEKDKNGSPNFVLTGFQNHFYNSNISNITRLLNEDLVQILTFYYSSLKLVIDYQDMLSKYNSEIKELSAFDSTTGELRPKFPITFEENQHLTWLIKKREDIKYVLRISLAPALFAKKRLLSILMDAFKKDPTQMKYIDVLPEHQAWWERIQKENLPSDPND